MTDPDIVTRLRRAEWYCHKSEEHMEFCDKKCAKRNLPNPDECRAAADEIERLRKELADAYSKSAQVIADLSANLCTTSALERERLTAERDRARRLVCELQCDPPERFIGLPHEVAQMYGWDCFPEATP